MVSSRTKERNLWYYHFSVYSPVNKRVASSGTTHILKGEDYPYRTEEFDMRWLERYHSSREEYWNTKFNPE